MSPRPGARRPRSRRAGARGRGAAAGRLDLATAEATNLHAVSVLVAVSALARAESRGCHRWRDTPPVTSAERARHTVVRVDAGLRPAAAVEAGAGAAA